MISAPTPVFPYSAATLRYSLLKGPVDLAPLRVLASRCVLWKGWQVTFSVLGASHAVCLERGDLCITELLACTVGEGASVPVMRLHPTEATPVRFCAQGLVGEATFTLFPLTEDADLSAESEPDSRLELAYPPYSDTATPYTRIGWRRTAEALTVETVHTYPEEGRGVRSRTVFREEEQALP